MDSLQLNSKNIFVVLGTPRSGTSAITRGLKSLGIDLGNKLTPGNERWNPKGFYEDNDVVYKINGEISKLLNFPLYGLKMLDNEQQTSVVLDEIKTSAIKLLKERFALTQYWGFKDPSTVKMLIFWQSIFNELNIKDHYVIVLRHPLAVAQSLQVLTKTDLEVCLLLWLMHVLPAIQGTHHKKRIIVSYELLQQNARKQLERIKNYFNLPELADSAAIDDYANEFLDQKLNRYARNEEELKDSSLVKIAPLCVTAYRFLMKLARDEITFDSEEFLSGWQSLWHELEATYPLYCYLDTLLRKNKQFKKQMHKINRSLVWRISYPIRVIDKLLGARRRKAREQRRLSVAYW